VTDHERSVLAACVLSEPACALATVRLAVDDFADPTARVIFRAIVWLVKKGDPVNRVTIRRAAVAHGHELPTEALLRLSEALPIVEDLPAYIRLVREDSIRRQLGARLADTAKKVAEESRAHLLPEILHDLGTFIQSASASLEPDKPAETVHEAVSELLAMAATPDKGIRWGLESMRKALPRIKPGELIVVAAQTSVGKSTFMALHAAYQARQGYRVLWIGLEMSRREMLATFCRVETGWDPSTEHAYRPTYAPEGACLAWADTWAPLPVTIRHDLHELDAITNAIRAACVSPEPPDIVYVDYLQIVKVPKAANDNARIAAVTGGLKTVGMVCGVPIITGSQFNREAGKESGEPQLRQLRDSGAIEQDANAVLILSREDATATNLADHAVRCRVAKYRGVGAGELIPLRWLRAYSVLGDDAMAEDRAHWGHSRQADWSARIPTQISRERG
jgi:replicative DNA helicase